MRLKKFPNVFRYIFGQIPYISKAYNFFPNII